jgi:hypothetical protein
MHINKLVEEVLDEAAIELLDMLAAHATMAAPHQTASLFFFPVDPDNWNATILLMHEIFDAEILIEGENEWLSFRILQSFGVKEGQLAYQFTPTFAQALS